jgi:YcxB-like protein
MDTPVIASFKWTQREFLLLQQVQMRHSPFGRKLRRGTISVGLLSIALGVGIIVVHGLKSAGIAFLPAGAGLLASPWFLRRANIKHYTQRPDRDMVVNWEFRAEGLRSKTESSSGEFSWSMITKVLRTPQGFLLYPNDRVFHWVPIHAFQDAEAIERFSQLVKSRVQHYDQVV